MIMSDDEFMKELSDLAGRYYAEQVRRRDGPDYDPQPCLIQQYFAEQEKLPAWRRSNICGISCPCPRCSVWCSTQTGMPSGAY